MGITIKKVTRDNAGMRYDIVNGPNKDTLFDNAKYAYSDQVRIPVCFHVVIGSTGRPNAVGTAYIKAGLRRVRIVEIQHEDGSGESFNLVGMCEADLASFTVEKDYKPLWFKAYYNTRSRKGSIVFGESLSDVL